MAFLFVVGDPDSPRTVGIFLYGNGAINMRQNARALRRPYLEQLLHPGQARGDVGAGDATRVERAHGQLGTGLADALGCDNTHSLSDLDDLAGSRQPAVTHLADAPAGLAGQRRPHGYPVDTGITDGGSQPLVDHLIAVDDNLAAGRVRDHVPGHTTEYALRKVRQRRVVGSRLHVERFRELAVRLLDDYFLGNVHQPPGQVAAVRGPQGGVG